MSRNLSNGGFPFCSGISSLTRSRCSWMRLKLLGSYSSEVESWKQTLAAAHNKGQERPQLIKSIACPSQSIMLGACPPSFSRTPRQFLSISNISWALDYFIRKNNVSLLPKTKTSISTHFEYGISISYSENTLL